MNRNIFTKNDRGQVGIGTLIVFIAMVLVAAIAAGVLINTAGFLQSKSTQTGQQSSQQVSDRVQVVTAYGSVNTSNSTVTDVNITVKRAPGANDINLSRATVEWVGPNTATTLIHNEANQNDTQFTIDDIKGEAPVIQEQEDRLVIQIDAAAVAGEGLGEGASVELTITTASGAQTPYRLTVPQSLSDKNNVQL